MTTEAEAIEEMLDRVQPEYPSASRDELREIFHTTCDRLAAELPLEPSQAEN